MIKKYGIYVVIFAICMAIGLKTAIDTPLAKNAVVFELTSSQPGMTELFYNIGEGFKPEHSIQVEVVETDKKTTVEYIIPQEQAIHLRWDPVYNENGVETTVHSAYVSYYGGENILDINFESVVPQNHIKTFEIGKNSLHFTVDKEQNDPYLVFTKVPEAPEAPSRTWLIVKGALLSVLSAILLSIVYRLIIAYFNS